MWLKKLLGLEPVFTFADDDPGAGDPPSNAPDDGDTPPAPSSWRDTLPDDLKEYPSFEKFKGVADLAKSYAELEKTLGKRKIPLPDPENATEEDWNKVFEALGRPPTPDEYTLPELPDEEKELVDEELVDEFKQAAHKYGLLPAQVEGLFSWFLERTKAAQAAVTEGLEQSRQEAEASLRKEWGAKYEENVALAQKVIQQYADEDAVRELTTELGNNPALIRLFAKVGATMSEDVLTGKPKGTFTMTPDEAKREILKIKADPNHPLNDEFHPEHEAAMARMETLYKLAYPELAKTK